MDNVGDAANATIENCYNRGNIIQTLDERDPTGDCIGGITGWLSDNSISIISHCYNAGKIELKGMEYLTVGGIVGAALNDISSRTIDHCYYIEGNVETDEKEIGESKTEEFMKTQDMVNLLNEEQEEGKTVWEIQEGENNNFPVLIKE